MSIYKQLDTMIQDRCMFKDSAGELVLDENSYLQLRDEINECKTVSEEGTLEFEQLSPIAQDIVAEWEGWIEAYAQAQYEARVNAEQPEDF